MNQREKKIIDDFLYSFDNFIQEESKNFHLDENDTFNNFQKKLRELIYKKLVHDMYANNY